MVSTTLRDAPPLAWPALRLAGGVKLVYLDQKDWVHLAQADTGHRDGTRYAAALRAPGTPAPPGPRCSRCR